MSTTHLHPKAATPDVHQEPAHFPDATVFIGATHAVAAYVRRIVNSSTPGARPARQHRDPYYSYLSYLELARMSREMERL